MLLRKVLRGGLRYSYRPVPHWSRPLCSSRIHKDHQEAPIPVSDDAFIGVMEKVSDSDGVATGERELDELLAPTHCPGCGTGYQSTKPSEPGYIHLGAIKRRLERLASENTGETLVVSPEPLEVPDVYEEEIELEEDDEIAEIEGYKSMDYGQFLKLKRKIGKKKSSGADELVCSRCFQLENYGEAKEAAMVVGEDLSDVILDGVRERVGVVVLAVVDIMDLQGSYCGEFLTQLRKDVGSVPMQLVLVVNKYDLLCKGAKLERIRHWVNRQVVHMMKDRPRKIHVVSSETGMGVRSMVDDVLTLCKDKYGKNTRDIFVVGATNVGKSSLLNKMLSLDLLTAVGSSRVTTSKLPGTTLGLVPFKLQSVKGQRANRHKIASFFDTPGIVRRHHLHYHLNALEFDAIMVNKPFRPVTYRIPAGRVMLLGALGLLEVDNPKCKVTFFFSPNVSLHMTKPERVGDLLKTQVGKKIYPPFTPERVLEIPQWRKTTVEVVGTGLKTSAVDIMLHGFGWISITDTEGSKTTVSVHCPTKVDIRDPLMPFESNHNVLKFYGNDSHSSIPTERRQNALSGRPALRKESALEEK